MCGDGRRQTPIDWKVSLLGLVTVPDHSPPVPPRNTGRRIPLFLWNQMSFCFTLLKDLPFIRELYYISVCVALAALTVVPLSVFLLRLARVCVWRRS